MDPVFSKDQPSYEQMPSVTIEVNKSLFLKLPTTKIGKSGIAEIPFYTTWIKKDGTLVNSSVILNRYSTMITTINIHFED